MAHQHSVRDTDTRFIINPITRAIRNETSRKTVLIQGDHNSERFTFELPRYVENHDMSLCNVVEVHYLNIDPKTKLQHTGFYTVDDLHVDGDQVVCSWLVSENATSIAGHLIFLVKYKCVENDIITYQWNTDRYSAISVSEGIDASDSFELEYVDIIEQWKESVVAGFADDIVVEVNKATKTLEARMDTFTSLANGSTAADAELMDIRVGADGVTYPNAGDAVRGQISTINTDYNNLITGKTKFVFGNLFDVNSCTNGYFRVMNEIRENTDYCYNTIPVQPDKDYIISANGVIATNAIVVAMDKYETDIVGLTPVNGVFHTTENTYFVAVSLPITVAKNNLQIEEGSIVTDYSEYRAYTMSELVGQIRKTLDNPLQIMSHIVNTNKTVHIKMIGDSITAGVGGTNYNMDGEIIYDDFQSNTNGYCWANLLRDYLENRFDCNVKNYGCSGNYSTDIVEHMSDLITNEDDIVICMIGTNNRPANRFSSLYSDICTIHEYCKQNDKQIIFVGCIPSEIEIDEYTISDVNNVIMAAVANCGSTYIPIYKLIKEYCTYTGTEFNTLLSDGLHPNDKGHKIIFNLICNALGFNV